MSDTRIFPSTPATLQAIAAMLATHGLTIDPTQPTGEVKHDRWDVSWSTPQPGQIAFTVNSHPFAEESFLWSKLTGVLGEPV
jgi:hypothetical protein